jgi:hypothetical protein
MIFCCYGVLYFTCIICWKTIVDFFLQIFLFVCIYLAYEIYRSGFFGVFSLWRDKLCFCQGEFVVV